MALEYWRAYAVSKDGKRMCRTVAVWDTKRKRVVDRYMEGYGASEREYGQWRGRMPPLKVERAY